MNSLRWALVGAIAALAVTAGTATADERQITDGEAHELTVGGGWASWTVGWQPGQRFAWHGGPATPLKARGYAFNLGIDAKRRPVGVYSICGGDGTPNTAPCRLFERTLPRGREHRLMDLKPYFHVEADRYGSALALLRVGPVTQPDGEWHTRTTFDLRRPGKRTWRWAERGTASALDLDRRHLVFFLQGAEGGVDAVMAVDLTGRRPVPRTLAETEDCRCTRVSERIYAVAVSGGYAYWLDTIYDAGEGWPVGTPGVETTISSTVERLDLTSPAAVRETITLPRPASELDVDGTRIFYRGLEDDSPIYELSGATWTPRQPQLENP